MRDGLGHEPIGDCFNQRFLGQPLVQPKGIDFLWKRKRWNGGLETVAVEVKWDSYTTRNTSMETVRIVEKGTPGGFLTSVADRWTYCFKGYS